MTSLIAIGAGIAALTGIGAGILVVVGVEFIDQVLKIDDPVGACGNH